MPIAVEHIVVRAAQWTAVVEFEIELVAERVRETRLRHPQSVAQRSRITGYALAPRPAAMRDPGTEPRRPAKWVGVVASEAQPPIIEQIVVTVDALKAAFEINILEAAEAPAIVAFNHRRPGVGA